MGNERDEQTVGIDRTQRRGEMRDAPAGVGRTVERIDDDHDVAVEILRSRFLRQHSHGHAAQQTQGRIVGPQISPILTVPFT